MKADCRYKAMQVQIMSKDLTRLTPAFWTNQRRDEGGLVVAIDLAGQEKGYPAGDHKHTYRIAHEAFHGKTVHAGEDYGPESIFQALRDLHADRIGHGT